MDNLNDWIFGFVRALSAIVLKLSTYFTLGTVRPRYHTEIPVSWLTSLQARQKLSLIKRQTDIAYFMAIPTYELCLILAA